MAQTAINSSNTLTLMVSGVMVSASVQAGAQFGPSWCGDVPCQGAALTPLHDASPLSSQSAASRFVAPHQLQAAGSITPSSVESSCAAAPSSLGARPVQQQQQQFAAYHLVPAHHRQEVKRHQLVQLPPAVPHSQRGQPTLPGARTAGLWPQQQQQQQHLLAPLQQQQVLRPLVSQGSSATSGLRASLSAHSSGADLGGSCSFSSSSGGGSNTTGSDAHTTAWQQLLKHQQLQLSQQQAQQQRMLVQFVPATGTLPGTSSQQQQQGVVQQVGGKRPPAPLSFEQQQRAAKKQATSAAVLQACLLATASSSQRPAAAYQQQQQQQLMLAGQPPQQLVLLKAPARQARALPPIGATLTKQRQQQQPQQQQALVPYGALTALPAGSAAAGVQHSLPAGAVMAPLRVLQPPQQKLLSWAGRVLNCQLQDAYLLASHLYQRVSGQLDDMLLISLGVTANTESVTMLVSLWVASKLEGHRRQVAGASKLAGALQVLTSSVTDIELHLMQRLHWQPYALFAR